MRLECVLGMHCAESSDAPRCEARAARRIQPLPLTLAGQAAARSPAGVGGLVCPVGVSLEVRVFDCLRSLIFSVPEILIFEVFFFPP